MKDSYENLMKKIEEIENHYNVDSIILEDQTKIWNLIRVILSSYIVDPNYIKNERKNKIKKIKFIIKESLLTNTLPNKVEICAFSDVESQKKVGTKYFDIYVDTLNELFENYFIFDWPSAKAQRNEIGKNHIPLKIPFSVLFKKVLPNKLHIRNKEILERVIEDFSKEYDLDEKIIKKYVLESIAVFKIIKEKTKKKLQRINPSVVLLRAAYGRFQMGVVQACRELGITTIELQHGMIYDYHFGYIKKTKSENFDCVPDMIFTWGDFFSNIISEGYLFKNENIISVGFPYVEKMVKKEYKTDKKIQTFCKKFKKIVLVSGVSAEYFDLFVNKVAKQNKKIGYLYKPHPRDTRKIEFNESNIIVMERERDIYSLFRYANVHLTVLSTTMLEALAFGLPSILITSDEIDIKSIRLIDNETIFLIKNTDEFIEFLSKENNVEQKAKKRAESFFKKNSLTTMKKTMNILLEGKNSKKRH